MIPVRPVPEPRTFDSRVRHPGNQWLAANPPPKEPLSKWSLFLGDLAEGFHGLCGYAAMLDPTGGTVDHFRSTKNYRHLAYEWDNYRFACAPLNSSKKGADDSVLDPFEVQAGWFEITLPSLQLLLTDRVPESHRAKAEFTLERLRLRDGERVIRWRRSWLELYEERKLTIEGLRDVAPLLAEAVERSLSAP